MEKGCGERVGEKGREGVKRKGRRQGTDICKLSGVTSYKSTHPLLQALPSGTSSKLNYLNYLEGLASRHSPLSCRVVISLPQRHSWSTATPVALDGGFTYFVMKLGKYRF